MRKAPQAVLAVAALALVVLGAWLVTVQVRNLANQAQAKCDYLPCISSEIVPEVIAGTVLVLLGATAGAFLIRGRRGGG